MINKKTNIFLFSLEMFGLLVLLIFSIMMSIASIHNMNMLEDIKSFIASAQFEETRNNTHIYFVESDELEESTIYIPEKQYLPPVLGKNGDIFLMPQSRMNYFPFFAEFMSYLFGGHAGVITENGYFLVEAMGGSIEEGFVFEYQTDLYTEERTVIGLRVNATKEERAQASQNALSLIGKPYNYLFILNTIGHYYCTDVCSRIYGREFGMNYQIDSNGFHVSLQDLFRSKDTYITFVKYKIGNQTYIYYLKNPNL